MFKNAYQYGKVVPLLNIQSKIKLSMVILTSLDKESLSGWSFSGPVKKAYDKTCKGFILLFESSTKA
jgi:hypothetical protein